MATIEDARNEIVKELRNVPGLRHVPDDPPESTDRFPFAVVYTESGVFQKQGFGWMINLFQINIELHIERQNLPRAYNKLEKLLDQIPKQLAIGHEAGRFTSVQTWGDITFAFSGNMSWAGVPTIGYEFIIDRVKLHDTTS